MEPAGVTTIRTMYQLFLVLHILGATVWTGGHLILATTVLPRALGRGDSALVRDFESRYEAIGIPADSFR